MSSSWKWQATVATITALVGAGAGYLLGLITARWLWREERRAEPPEQLQPAQPPAPSSGELATAIAELTAEVTQLRQAIQADGLELASRRSLRTADSASDFVSAQGDNPESEEEEEEAFFDIETSNTEEEEEEEEERGGEGREQEETVQLDELGKKTLESEEVCNTLIERLKAGLENQSGDVGLLWRLARAEVHLSMHHEQREDKEREQSLLEEAVEHARQALEGDSMVWQAHQWYAVSLGSLSKSEGTQRKIQGAHEYKKHIEIALSLHPEENTLHYLKGRWCYEVAGVSWLEKKAAAALFAAPPEATYADALACFMKAEELSSDDWKTNLLMIAKCHIKVGDIPVAVEWLHKALSVPTKTSEDEGAAKEIRQLLEQHDETFSV